MARLGRSGFLAIAVIFHLIYVRSIFDIYFVSPIVTGMRAFGVDAPEAPATRLVLFVGDGLRADKAFQSFPDPSPSTDDFTSAQEPRPLAPFLRSRVLSHGTFGVSHTRVPTESRPGHVALIAGLYEDVSAVMTGWKLNPVNFDSVFNRSRHTWSWGSPDILPMFKEGAVPGRVEAFTYEAEAEDFTQDAAHLDTWVFERVKDMFENAASDATLDAALRDDKVVFFLHLLGLDTTGHAYRPYSREYLQNIKVVDQGVEEITKVIEDFYGDGKTAFVFTADHGMSDWGSHGDGHPDNTRTPLIAWGSGVAKPVLASGGLAAGHEDGFSSDWNLDHVQRNDVAQADIAALMAYLAGLEYPVNSVGELPLPYLAADLKTKAKALLANAQEILEMYKVKETDKKTKALRYVPFPPLGGEEHSVEQRVSEAQQLIDAGAYELAMKQSDYLIQLGIQGLRYLQTYDWFFLRTLVTVGYLGFVAFTVTTIVDLYVLHGKTEASRSTISITFFTSTLIAMYSVLYNEQSSWTYYAYAAFPVVFWEEVFARRRALWEGKLALLGDVPFRSSFFDICIRALAFVALLEALVQSYFHREVFTICYILAVSWPFFYGLEFVRNNMILVTTWVLSCASMSLFTLLPANKVEDINLILLGGLLMFAVGAIYLLFENSIDVKVRQNGETPAQRIFDNVSRSIFGAQTGLVALAMLVTWSSVKSLRAKTGLPFGTQIVGWIVLICSLTVPFFHSLQPRSHYLHRLTIIFLTFAPIFVILTISYEGLFYLAFCTTLVSWVRLEHHIYRFNNVQRQLITSPSAIGELEPAEPTIAAAAGRDDAVSKQNYRALSLADARISLFFLFLLQSAFFSTGNIASISSFSLDAVYRLIPVFDPFSQGALLVLKIMVPFALISANLGILNKRLKIQPGGLFAGVMMFGEWGTIRFFWSVKDEGSWLDIGTSITNFCIASALCIFVAALEGVSGALLRGVEFDDDESQWAPRSGQSTHEQEKSSVEEVDGHLKGAALPNGLP